jgi:aconitate hydratase
VQGIARCIVTRRDGTRTEIPLTCRLDTPEDIAYWRHGGILPFVWREYMNNDNPRVRIA